MTFGSPAARTAPARRALAVLLAVLGLTTTTLATAAAPAQAAARLAVQVTGVFKDSTDPSARAATSTVVVGAVATARLGFVAPSGTGTVTGGQAFAFSVVCADTTGTPCPDGTTLDWDFGDGQGGASTTIGVPNPDDVTPLAGGSAAQSPLTEYHPYTTPGAYTVRVSVTNPDPLTPAYGTGAIRALVGDRYADVDAAYTSTDATGAPGPSKAVNPLSEAVWTVSALGLMPSCKPYYSANSALVVPGARAEDPGRALFCPAPGEDLVSAAGGAQTFPTTNPASRSDYTTDTWNGSYTNSTDCLALAFNCGLPASVFAGSGTPHGSPLAACTSACQAVLANRGLLTSASGGRMTYQAGDCADNETVTYDPSATRALTVARGVEPGCESRGDFLRALLKAVDAGGQNALSDTSGAVALDSRACADTSAPQPDPAGHDGLRRATALLSGSGADILPCDPDVALTKGEAYRMLAGALVGSTPITSGSTTLADLEDRSLGWGSTREPYCGPPGCSSPAAWKTQIYALLAAGAPLVGSGTCPTANADGTTSPACFNPYEPLTRAGAAQLLAYFVLGDTSDVAAVQVRLSADSTQVNLGATVQLRLNIQIPSWLLPFTANWALGLGAGVPGADASFACTPHGTRTLSPGTATMSLTCPLRVNAQPAGGALPVTVALNGKVFPGLTLQVNNTPPTVTTVSVPSLTEDGGTAVATASFSDPEDNPISALQVSAAVTGPWSDLVDGSQLEVRATTVDNVAATGKLELTPAPDANGPYTFYLRACDIGNACSVPKTVTGTIGAVNDPPVAFPISNVMRTDDTVSTSGNCTTAQTGPLGANLVQLRGADPADDGRSGYSASFTAYTVSAPSAPLGTMYVCAFNGTWTAVAAGSNASTPNPVVLWNPTVGQYGQNTFSYTVTDAGYPTGGLVSAPQPITVTNTKPGVPPTAALSVDVTNGATFATAFTFDASASNEGGSAAAIVSYAFDFGDGQQTSAQTSTTAAHRYTSPGSYIATVTVTDVAGATATASVRVVVDANLIGNPTFESGTGQWVPAGAGGDTVALTAAAPHGGTQAASVTRASGTDCLVSHTPPALIKNTKAGYLYKTTEWVRPTPDSTGKTLALTLTETGTGGASQGSLSTSVTLGSAGVWQQVPLSYKAVADGDTLVLTTGLASFAGTACFDLDDVAMTGDTAATTYATTVLSDRPLAYFKLDETSGTTAANAVGPATGTYAGTYTLGQAPLPSSGSTAAWLVGGADARVNLAGLGVNTSVGAKTTVEMWVNVPGTSAPFGMVFGFDHYDLYYTGGKFGFNTGCADVWGIPDTVATNGRHHIVAVFTNGSVAADALYVDGVAQSLSQQTGTSCPAGKAAASVATISGWPYTANQYGPTGDTIDEVSIYNGELPASRVLAHYNAGK